MKTGHPLDFEIWFPTLTSFGRDFEISKLAAALCSGSVYGTALNFKSLNSKISKSQPKAGNQIPKLQSDCACTIAFLNHSKRIHL